MSIEKSMGDQAGSGDKLVLDESNPGLYDAFKGLIEKEDGMVQQGELRGCCYAYFNYGESGELYASVLGTTENLKERWKLLATQADVALGSPRGVLSWTHWLHRLVLDGRANGSEFIHMYSETVG